MATRKFRKSAGKKKSRTARKNVMRYKTTRGRRTSTAGKILPPLDVRSNKHLKDFEKRIRNGDLTIILVWAQWCPHCHTMMPHFDAAAKSPNRSIQAVKVEEQMLPAVNEVLTKNVNRAAKPLNVEGYPSIIVVDKQGNKVTDVEPVRNTSTMTQVMENAGPLAVEAGLNKPKSMTNSMGNSVSNSVKPLANSVKPLANSMNKNEANKNKNKQFLANLGIEDEGLATAGTPRNIDMGEEELKGSIASTNSSISLKPKNKPQNVVEETEEAEKPTNVVAPPSSPKKLEDEANEITSLVAPLTPPSMGNDMEENNFSISNTLTPEQKLSGGGYGGRHGGSLYSAMARTTYTLAPAAALLATAAMVMKGKKSKTRKHSKKGRRRTHRGRR